MKKRKGIRRGNEPIPALVAWMKGRPKAVGIFGQGRDFPITTKELATIARNAILERLGMNVDGSPILPK